MSMPSKPYSIIKFTQFCVNLALAFGDADMAGKGSLNVQPTCFDGRGDESGMLERDQEGNNKRVLETYVPPIDG